MTQMAQIPHTRASRSRHLRIVPEKQKGPEGGDAIRASLRSLVSCSYRSTTDDTAWRTEAWPPTSQHMQVIIINTVQEL